MDMNNTKYCCVRFAEAVNANEILHSESHDETDWYIEGLWHIYYCPFCGADVKGQGWGEFEVKKIAREG
jgi:hypothetical protein